MIICQHYQQNECRSCDLINFSQNEQILQKESHLKEITPSLLPSIISHSVEFRDKMKLAVGGSIESPSLGIVTNDYNIQDLSLCLLHSKWLQNQIPLIKDFIKLAHLLPYDIKTRKGELKFLILFYSPSTNQSYIRFVLRSKEAIDRIKKHLLYLSPFNQVTANIQPEPAALIEGKDEIHLGGTTHISHSFNDLIFDLHPQNFVQTNTYVASKLYQIAQLWISKLEISKGLDFFCGIGTFTLHLSKLGIKMTGVEINPISILMARQSANRLNQEVLFYTLDEFHFSHETNFDLIVVNPPRAGLKKLVDDIIKIQPKYILYSSCDYQTLRLDLEKLSYRYKIIKAQMFDMFPHTSHFETLILLEKITS